MPYFSKSSINRYNKKSQGIKVYILNIIYVNNMVNQSLPLFSFKNMTNDNKKQTLAFFLKRKQWRKKSKIIS